MTRSHQVNVNSIRPQETRAAGFLSEKQVQIRYGGEYLKLKAGVPSWKVSGVSGITGAPRALTLICSSNNTSRRKQVRHLGGSVAAAEASWDMLLPPAASGRERGSKRGGGAQGEEERGIKRARNSERERKRGR